MRMKMSNSFSEERFGEQTAAVWPAAELGHAFESSR